MRTQNMKIAALAIVSLALCATGALGQQTDRLPDSKLRDGTDVRIAYTSVVALADQATVRIRCGGKEAELGTVVDSDGWIVTKYSELRTPITVQLADERKLPAKVVGYDPQTDLAMLKIEADHLQPVPWAEGHIDPAVGQLVATASPGNLPRAIGVVSLPCHGVPARNGLLGIQLEFPDGSAKITSIFPNSGAAQAGLQVGDLVTHVANTPIHSSDALIEMIQRYKPGDKVALQISRGDKQLQVSATLGNPGRIRARTQETNTMGSSVSHRATDFPNVIQHDSALRPEDCGGPLVDLSGKALGINIARAGRIASYALPADQILPLLADLKDGKLAPRGALPKASE